MSINYDVPAGQVFVLNGPATVNVGRSFESPVISPRGEAPAAPVLNSLAPATAVSGDTDMVLHCNGSGFTHETTIMFGDYDEPTTFVSEAEVTTIVKPSLFAPADVQVCVRNGPLYSANQTFTFTDPGRTSSRS